MRPLAEALYSIACEGDRESSLRRIEARLIDHAGLAVFRADLRAAWSELAAARLCFQRAAQHMLRAGQAAKRLERQAGGADTADLPEAATGSIYAEDTSPHAKTEP